MREASDANPEQFAKTYRKVARDQEKLKSISGALFNKFHENEEALVEELRKAQREARAEKASAAKVKKEMEAFENVQKEMERRTSELAQKVEKLSSALHESKKKSKAEVDKYAALLSEAETKAESLTSELRSKDAEFEKKFRSVHMELEIEKKKAAQSDEELMRVKGKMEALEADAANVQKVRKQLERERDDALLRAESFEKEASSLEGQLKAAADARDEALIRVSNAQEKFADEKEALEASIASLEQEQRDADTKIKGLVSEINEMSAANEGAIKQAKEKYEAESAHMLAEHAKKIEEIQIKHEREMKEYETKLGDEAKMKEELRSEMEKEIETMQAEAERVAEEKVRRATGDQSSLKAALEDSQREAKELKAQLAQANLMKADALSNSESAEEALKLKAEIDALSAAVDTGIAERDALRAKDAEIIKKMKRTMKSYETALVECGINPKSICDENLTDESADDKLGKIAEMKSMIIDLKKQLASTKEELRNAQHEIDHLEEERSERRDSAPIDQAPMAPPIEPSMKNLRKYSRRISEIQSLQSDRRESLRMIIDMKGDIRSMREEAERKRKELESERDHFKGLLEELKRAVEARASKSPVSLSVGRKEF